MSVMKADTNRMSHPAVAVEVLVIGGGVIGSSIAYHVARQGRKVLVVERQEVAVEPVASWASAGGIRRQGQDPAVGRCVADHLAGLPTPELDQLTPNRIAHFDPSRVAAFLSEPATS